MKRKVLNNLSSTSDSYQLPKESGYLIYLDKSWKKIIVDVSLCLQVKGSSHCVWRLTGTTVR